ncbi:MAG: 1,4-dihydroxy-2-naphthoate polyprenyltransferase [Bacteroidetes bacterium]|nr:1,4-dihydroxy-2-naphthoate polyprenyltransferase [Bacteroidota bacterium]
MANRVAIWWEAARPKTLWAAASPVFIGIALAIQSDNFHLVSAVLALAGALFIQIGTNYYNDLADFQKGADGADRKGPRRMVQAGMVSQAQMKRATILVFALAVLSGVYLMLRGGWPIVGIGVSSIGFGLAYTGGRYSLAYLGLADGFVLLFFGPVAVAGTYFVQTLTWPPVVWVAGLAPGFLAVAILLVNNIRDRAQDASAGKKTLIVRLGRTFGHVMYATCLLAAIVVTGVLWQVYDASAWILLSLLAAPMMAKAFVQLRSVPESESQHLNPVLASTARNLLLYSVLLSLGLILGTAS